MHIHLHSVLSFLMFPVYTTVSGGISDHASPCDSESSASYLSYKFVTLVLKYSVYVIYTHQMLTCMPYTPYISCIYFIYTSCTSYIHHVLHTYVIFTSYTHVIYNVIYGDNLLICVIKCHISHITWQCIQVTW